MAVHHFGEAITAYRLGRALRHLDLGTKNPLGPCHKTSIFVLTSVSNLQTQMSLLKSQLS